MNKALILLSGGLDSTTLLGYARDHFRQLYAISFRYGQKHSRFELKAARIQAHNARVAEYKVINIDGRAFDNSALTRSDIEVPKNREIDKTIPVTYVPSRNIIFLSYALAFAETRDITNILIGANAVDYSGYPDCRPEFIESFEKMANLGTKMADEGKKIKIHAPLINLSKKEIIEMGIKYNIDYSRTHSCYDPTKQGHACGECDSCILRKKGFKEANIKDPTKYKYV